MKTNKNKFNITQAIRLCLQIAFFVFLPTLYYSAFSGLKQIFMAIVHQNSGLVQLPGLVAAIAVVPATILLGRFFCGWMCAFGAFLDFIYIICKKLFKFKFKMSEKADGVLKYAKYVWLLALVVLWTFGSTVFAAASPWDVFGMIATVGKAPAISYVITNLTLGFILFCLIIIGSAFIERFFCRYLCPLGAVFAVVSKLRLTRINKPREKCGSCRICTNSCAMGIPLYKSDKIGSGECIHCMKCANACPRGNISLTVNGGDLRPLVAGTVTVAAMTGIYYLGDLTTTSVKIATNTTAGITSSVSSSAAPVASSSSASSYASKAAASSSTASVDKSKSAQTSSSSVSNSNTSSYATTSSAVAASNLIYNNGTYQGSGTGFRGGTTTVSVTIKNDKITAINVVSTDDDQQFFDSACSAVTGQILSAQKTEVDAVSGATYSSNGIMEAVASAMANAKG